MGGVATEWPLSLKPGVHPEVPAAVYHALPAASSSFLHEFERSPRHAFWMRSHPRESAAMDLGQLFHTRLLEPEEFEARYVVLPETIPNRRFKEGKAFWAQYEKQYPTQIRVPHGDAILSETMVAAVQAHPVAGALLASRGMREPTLIWRDPETGLACRARLDLLTMYLGHSTIVDFKSCRDASRSGFARSVASYGYDLQAAWYLRGADVLSPRPRRFLFVAVESAPPHGVAVYELDNDWIAHAHGRLDYLVTRLAECEKTGVWPGYPVDVQTLLAPAWMRRVE